MVAEAELKETEAGLVPASVGSFVMNAHDARWFDKPGQGRSLPLTGYDEYEAETSFPMLGMAIRVVRPGEPTGTYHWETEQEDFLVLSGEALLIVEGRDRSLKQWDFVHCPPETRHALVGAGEGRACSCARAHRSITSMRYWSGCRADLVQPAPVGDDAPFWLANPLVHRAIAWVFVPEQFWRAVFIFARTRSVKWDAIPPARRIGEIRQCATAA